MADVVKGIAIVTFLGFSLDLVKCTTVDITQQWKSDLGWEITCSWELYANDSLQSVSLKRNNQQFMIYRPENQPGSSSKKETWNHPESIFNVQCIETEQMGVKGKCVFTVEPLLPPKRDIRFGCEVSGERPYFRMDVKDVVIEALVKPTDAEMTVIRQSSGPVTVNCTSSALPAPTIVWTIDNQKIPHNFHGTPTWNATSKLWSVWSSFSPQDENEPYLQCTPEVLKGNHLIKGKSAYYNGASKNSVYFGMTVFTIISILLR